MTIQQKAFQHSKKAWAASGSRLRVCIPSLVALALLAGSNPAMAGTVAPRPPKMQKMMYEVYAGGINAVSAELDISMKPKDRYSVVLSAFTKGFLGALAPWKGTFETHGWIKKDGTDQPELHRSTATWRDEEEIKEYHYDRNGHFSGYNVKDPDHNGETEKLDPELVEGTIDVMTAALSVMKEVGHGQSCAGESEIFDGKRRFKLAFKFEAEEELIATRYNVYEGPSQRCVIEVTPTVGEWHSKPRGWMSIQEQGRQAGSLPTVWFAKLNPNSPAVPVKIRVKSEYGAMFMHLVNYDDGDSVKTAGVIADKD